MSSVINRIADPEHIHEVVADNVRLEDRNARLCTRIQDLTAEVRELEKELKEHLPMRNRLSKLRDWLTRISIENQWRDRAVSIGQLHVIHIAQKKLKTWGSNRIYWKDKWAYTYGLVKDATKPPLERPKEGWLLP